MYRLLVLFLFLANTIAVAQTDELHFLKGKIICQNIDFTTVFVTNKRSESTVNPENNGNFSMFVKVGDKLVFEGMTIDAKEIVLTKDDLAKKLLAVSVLAKVIPLEVVEIKQYKNINAVALGILQKPAKEYTPAERRLRTASAMYPTASVGMMAGGSLGLDPLINAITGRTTMLKKELEIERSEFTMRKLENQFEENYFTEKLKIPKEYVAGFLYYVSDDMALRNALAVKDKIKTEFALSKLASEYLILLKEEKK